MWISTLSLCCLDYNLMKYLFTAKIAGRQRKHNSVQNVVKLKKYYP